jgi:hypothetical protein
MKTTLFLSAVLIGTAAFSTASAEAVDPKRLSEIVRVLASDEFQGRSPGTEGETKTINYLVESFRSLGLEPGGERGGWTQEVPLLRTQLETPRTLQMTIKGKSRPLVQTKDIYLSTVQDSQTATIDDAPLVFVGYGVTAPERQWDDYKGVDLRGKVAVYLINDPDFSAPADEAVAGKFGGRRMTYYGRWTYKFEEASSSSCRVPPTRARCSAWTRFPSSPPAMPRRRSSTTCRGRIWRRCWPSRT